MLQLDQLNDQKNDVTDIKDVVDNEIINYKEAIIFGFLGVLRLRNEINCLSSITGAKKDHCSGVIFE